MTLRDSLEQTVGVDRALPAGAVVLAWLERQTLDQGRTDLDPAIGLLRGHLFATPTPTPTL